MKSNFIAGNRLQEIGNRLPESKNSGKLENFEKKTLLKNKTVLCFFLKNLFNTSLVKSSWFLLLNLEFIFSWILKSNFTWFLNLLDFFTWNLKLILILNLLTQSWNHSLAFLSSSKLLESTWFIITIHHHEACFYMYEC